MKTLIRLLNRLGVTYSSLFSLFRRRDCGYEYASFLRQWGNFSFIGEGTYISIHSRIESPEMVIIGNQAHLGNCVLLATESFLEYSLIDNPEEAIVIGDFVSIADGVKIYPGVTIGAHARILPGAVVTSDVGAHSVVIGDRENSSGRSQQEISMPNTRGALTA